MVEHPGGVPDPARACCRLACSSGLCSDESGTACWGAGHLLRCYPEVASPTPGRPAATFWQPSGLTDPEHPNSRANPEGWQTVAGGRSGQRGNDHRKTAADSRAPRRGARPGPDTLQAGSLERALQRRVWHSLPGCRTSSALLSGGRLPHPPATSGYLLATLRVDRSRAPKLQSQPGGLADGSRWSFRAMG
jgi:hypothetical protein